MSYDEVHLSEAEESQLRELVQAMRAGRRRGEMRGLTEAILKAHGKDPSKYVTRTVEQPDGRITLEIGPPGI